MNQVSTTLSASASIGYASKVRSYGYNPVLPPLSGMYGLGLGGEEKMAIEEATKPGGPGRDEIQPLDSNAGLFMLALFHTWIEDTKLAAARWDARVPGR